MGIQGEGAYAQVIKCVNVNTSEVVAIKIHKGQDEESFQHELEIIQAVRALDPDKKNIVRFIEVFRSDCLACMAFEMLDRSLLDLMDERNGLPLSLNEIRPITHQILVALEALNSIGIMHRDLKPNNIMLVNHREEPFRIKVIDFGMALPIWRREDTEIIQNLSYRAPEVNLGLPLSEAVDMWSVGCIMAHLYFGYSLFPYKCPYNWMETVLCLLGWPSNEMLLAGKYSRKFFIFDPGIGWRLRTPGEYRKENHVKRVFSGVSCYNLECEVVNGRVKQNDLEYKDRMVFLDLLKSCLQLEAQNRIIPSDALTHHYVTMVHMVDSLETSSYGDNALDLMVVSPLDNLDETTGPLNSETSNKECDSLGDFSKHFVTKSSPLETWRESSRSQTSETNPDEESDCGWGYSKFSHANKPKHDCSHKSSTATAPCNDGVTEQCSLSKTKEMDSLRNTGGTGSIDKATADVGQTDGAAASVPSNFSNKSAINPMDKDDVKMSPEEAPQKNIFQKARNIFRRVWEWVDTGR